MINLSSWTQSLGENVGKQNLISVFWIKLATFYVMVQKSEKLKK